MSGGGYQKKWLRAGKVIEYYIDGGPWASSYRDAEYQLYSAVVDGEIRARIDGKPFNEFDELRKKKWSPSSLYALPLDLELNLEDVQRIWDWSKYDLADMLARGLIHPASAEMSTETGILNLKILLERVRVRLSVMSLKQALTETDFQKRWGDLTRSLELYFGSRLIESARHSELFTEYELCKQVKKTEIDKQLDAPPLTGTPGRPTMKEWFLEEHARRINAGNSQVSITAEAAALLNWLKQAHPGHPQYPGRRTIENCIRDEHRRAHPLE